MPFPLRPHRFILHVCTLLFPLLPLVISALLTFPLTPHCHFHNQLDLEEHSTDAAGPPPPARNPTRPGTSLGLGASRARRVTIEENMRMQQREIAMEGTSCLCLLRYPRSQSSWLMIMYRSTSSRPRTSSIPRAPPTATAITSTAPQIAFAYTSLDRT